jgi:hypothetical protein
MTSVCVVIPVLDKETASPALSSTSERLADID